MSALHVTLANRWFHEVWNERRDDTIDELLDAESVCHADDTELRGPEAFRERIHRPFLAAFPDLRIVVESAIGQDDHVAVRWLAEGTHACDGVGCPPTGRRVTFRGVTWIRFAAGKFREGWQHTNIAEVLRGLAGGA